MYRQSKSKKKATTIFFLTFVFLLVFLLDLGGYLDGMRSKLDVVMNPIRFWATSQSRKATTFFRDISSISSMRTENSQLKSQVLDLESSLSVVSEVERENKVLREQLNILPEEEYVLMKADIVGGDLRTGGAMTFIINKGEEDGVNKGQSVMYSGYLIGIVSESFPGSSVVMVIKNKDVSVPVISEKNRTKGLVIGNVESGVLMTKILREEFVDVGEKILTSGIGGFPKGLIVGKILSIRGEDADVEKVAVLEGFVKIGDIEEVFIIDGEKS